MSQKVSRKSTNEEKEKRQTDSPVKEMKKKMAATAEKEKQAAATEKAAEKQEKNAEKATEKQKNVEKATEKQRHVEKQAEKQKQPEKSAEKSQKHVEKDKKSEKTDKPEKIDTTEKKEDSNKGEKSSKAEKPEEKPKRAEPARTQNGDTHNGVKDVTLSSNGVSDELNGTVSADSDDELLVIDDHIEEQDELFPELTYDDTSDVECFEPPTPENAPSRSLTRRSQAKATRTPETPRPASGRQPDAADDSKESKVLKLKDDATSDRKLRSADSPKPEKKKPDEEAQENEPNDGSKAEDKMEVEVVIEVDGNEDEPRKPGTNFAKSRVKVSPYRRSLRRHDVTQSSVVANYTGNNTTMEMDITESSSFADDQPLDDSSYLSGLRSIRGRRSYKPLKEMTLRNLANRSARSNTGSIASEQPSRPTGTVVGRKRKPDNEDSIELATDAAESAYLFGKRMRLLDRIAQPFRRTLTSTPLPRRATDIVGINTDLPLTAPVATPETFDPESLKTPPATPSTEPATPATDRDAKRCIVM